MGYTWFTMADALTISRETGNGRHSDILDVAEHLGRGIYGSATNALVVMVRQSPLFRETVKKLPKRAKALESVPEVPGQPGQGEETG